MYPNPEDLESRAFPKHPTDQRRGIKNKDEIARKLEVMSGTIKDINDSTFKTEVLGAKILTMVEYYAVWSDVCRMMKPTVEKIAADYKGKAQVAYLDIDKSPQTTRDQGITAIPTFFVYKGGKVVGRRIGPSTYEQLAEIIDKNL